MSKCKFSNTLKSNFGSSLTTFPELGLDGTECKFQYLVQYTWFPTRKRIFFTYYRRKFLDCCSAYSRTSSIAKIATYLKTKENRNFKLVSPEFCNTNS